MQALAPISNIEARIGSIRARVDPTVTDGMQGAFDAAYLSEIAEPEVPDDFDPFGAAYQQAVDASRTQAATSTYNAGRLQTFGTATGVSGSGGIVTVPGSSFVPTGMPGASVGKIGGFGPMPVPQELAVYGNGQIPSNALQSIGQGGHQLWGPAAQSWKNAVAAARVDGIDLKVTDSYRSYDQQVDLANRKGLYKDGGLGATPGTSNHGWGLAVDIDVSDPATMSWVRANGWRFGFVEAVPREPWHWEFRPQQA